MKTTAVAAVIIVFLWRVVFGIRKDGRDWFVEGKDHGDIILNCIHQSHNKIKLSIYSEQQCLALPPI